MWTTCRLLVASLLVVAVFVPSHGLAAPSSSSSKRPTPRTKQKSARPSAIGVLDPRAPLLSVSISPGTITLHGRRSQQTVLVTGKYADGTARDLTGTAKLVVTPGKVAALSGQAVVPRGDGQAVLKATAGGKSARARVTVAEFQAAAPVSFTRDVVPALTQAGCNSLSCHGSPSGRAGFKLSMYGAEPAADHQAITRQERAAPNQGKRIDPEAPEKSLVLLKPTMGVPHQGGLRFALDFPRGRLLVEWLKAGAPMDAPDTVPRLSHLVLSPGERTVAGVGKEQGLLVRAEFSDGSAADVTHQAVFTSNDENVATVDSDGRATAVAPGETVVLARCLGRVGFARLLVAPPVRPAAKECAGFRPANFIDQLALARWKKVGTAPSDLCTDAEFLRRVSLDLTGTLPVPDEVRKFMADRDPAKRSKKIEELLGRPEYADWWSVYWGETLRNNVRTLQPQGSQAFHTWIRESVAQNKPYDQFVRELILANGSTFENGPTNFYRVANTPAARGEQVAQIFLGVRLQCANCHNHPFEKWTRSNYHAFAAFFARLQTTRSGSQGFQINLAPRGEYQNPETRQVLAPEALDTKVDITEGADRREPLAAWLTSPENAFLARNLANRLWAQLFGKGITEPVDDVRATNPPSNEPLLDRLGKELVARKFDVKALVRLICNSRTYQLSTKPNRFNKADATNFSRATLRRLKAEQLLDAICQVTNVPENFGQGVPRGTRAIQLPDNRVQSYFLDTFGRPRREVVCACERTEEANLSQALHMLNGETLNRKIADKSGRAAELAGSERSVPEVVEELYLWALGRPPTPAERERDAAQVSQARDRRTGIEDRLWVLLNMREFMFNH